MRSYADIVKSMGQPTYDAAARHRFVHAAGASYGALFVGGFALTFWLVDALQLAQASAHLAWAKLAAGLLVGLPLGIGAGWLAARARAAGVSVLIWIVGGVALAWIAGHIPYQGVSFVAGLGDLHPSASASYPYPRAATAFTGVSMVVGALFGLVIGLLEVILIGRAWDRSTVSNRLGRRSLLALSWCVPPAVLMGLYVDSSVHEPIRRPVVDVAFAVDIALDPGADLGRFQATALLPYRRQLTRGYTVYWVATGEPFLDEEDRYVTVDTIDVEFAGGMLLRCRYRSGGDAILTGLTECYALDRELFDWMRQLTASGSIECPGCFIRVEEDVRRWLLVARLDLETLREVSLAQHQGGWFYARATFASDRLLDCRFSSDEPIRVDMCIEVGD